MRRKMTDRELLLELKTDMCWIKKMLNNHLAHHWIITVSAIGAALSSMGALLVFLITKK